MLLGTVVEDRDLVLVATMGRGWIVGAPDQIEQVGVGDDARVEVQLKGLGVLAEVVVGRVLRGPTAVADAGADDAVETPKLRVGAPESPEGKCRSFQVSRHLSVDGDQELLKGLSRFDRVSHQFTYALEPPL